MIRGADRMRQYSQLVRHVRDTAYEHGIHGDPHADPPPILTLDDEWRALHLHGALRPDIRRLDTRLAHQMCRAIIATAGGT